MALSFLSKKPSGKGYIPTDRIRDLASKGFSEPEIIDILRKDGFLPEEVDKGLSQALKISVSADAPSAAQTPSMPQQPSPAYRQPQQQPQLPEFPTLEQLQQSSQPAQQLEIPETSLPQEYYSSYSTEEYIDYLVSQRVTELYDRLAEISDKYEDLSSRLEEFKGIVSNLEKGKSSVEQMISGKIEELRGSVIDVSSRVGGLEKAFKDTLPSIIESVRALADLIRNFKKPSGG